MRLFEPNEETIYDRFLSQMRELERLAQKRPCTMTQEQWNSYESWQEKKAMTDAEH